MAKIFKTCKSLLGQNYECDKGNDQIEKGSMDYVKLGFKYFIEFINEKLSHLDVKNRQ